MISLFSFAIWFADNLKFSWAFLTYSLSWLFYWTKFWIFLFTASFWASLSRILCLYSLSSFTTFCCWALESLKFYWAILCSSLRKAFSWNNFWIFFFISSLSLLFKLIVSLYSFNYWANFDAWFVEILNLYCPSLTSFPRSLFSPVSLLKSSFIWLNCLAKFWPSETSAWRSLSYRFLFSIIMFSLSIYLVMLSILNSYSLASLALV